MLGNYRTFFAFLMLLYNVLRILVCHLPCGFLFFLFDQGRECHNLLVLGQLLLIHYSGSPDKELNSVCLLDLQLSEAADQTGFAAHFNCLHSSYTPRSI